MDGAKLSPFPAASDIPLQRNPPLAPSQELAYRNKCIQLKKRLAEIEGNNDMTRKRISAEKERVHKQRLLRAILLNQLREIMETPGKKFKPEELERMGIVINGGTEDEDHIHGRSRPEGEVLLDDSSEDSDEDPEPSDRPTRTRRQNNNYRGETIMNTRIDPNPSMYQQPDLPAIAPAQSYSPAASREPLLTSSFQTPVPAVGSPQQYSTMHQSTFIPDARYAQAQSSPVHTAQPTPGQILANPTRSLSQSQIAQPQEPNGNHYRRDPNPSSNPPPSLAQPVRPSPPYNQFCEHMRPQLEADNYPREQIQARIDEEWRKLSTDNRALWDERYNDQMREYEQQMDDWKRAQRRFGDVTPVGGRATGFR